MAWLAGCGGGEASHRARAASPPTRDWPVVAPADPARANAVLMRAISLVGTPYRWGGNTPEGGFDCSGLIGYVYKNSAGVAPPRAVAQLAGFGQRVDAGQLRTGDLVVFGTSHAGIYVGEGRFVHAPSTGGTVRMDSLQSRHWARQGASFRRP